MHYLFPAGAWYHRYKAGLIVLESHLIPPPIARKRIHLERLWRDGKCRGSCNQLWSSVRGNQLPELPRGVRKSGTQSLIYLMKNRNGIQLFYNVKWSPGHPGKKVLWRRTLPQGQSRPTTLPLLSSFLGLGSSSLWYTADTPLFTCCIFLPSFLFQSSNTVPVSSLLVGSSSKSIAALPGPVWSGSSGYQPPFRDLSLGGASQRASPDPQGSCFLAWCVKYCPGFGVHQQY